MAIASFPNIWVMSLMWIERHTTDMELPVFGCLTVAFQSKNKGNSWAAAAGGADLPLNCSMRSICTYFQCEGVIINSIQDDACHAGFGRFQFRPLGLLSGSSILPCS